MTFFEPITKTDAYLEFLYQVRRERAQAVYWLLSLLACGPALASILIPSLNDWIAQGGPSHPAIAFWFNPLGGLWRQREVAHADADADFDAAFAFSREQEGECNHNSAHIDVAGFTCKGISQGFLDNHRESAGVSAEKVTDLTEQETKKLYRFIWDTAQCERFRQPMDLLCMDSALNFGPRWTEFLDELTEEGIDPVNGDPKKAAKRFAEMRIAYRSKRVAEDPTQKAFIHGWRNRDHELLAYIEGFKQETSLNQTTDTLQKMFPLAGLTANEATITSPYGYRNNPTGEGREFHSGTDYAAALKHPVIFPEAATVQATYPAREGGGCGAGVELVPKSDPSVLLIFCHLTDGSNSHLQKNKEYPVGTLLGLVGMTGRTTGPHLHLGIKQQHEWADPQPYIESHYQEKGVKR